MTASPTTEPVAYHWVLTLQGFIGGVMATTGDRGVLAVPPGKTRDQVLAGLQARLMAQVPGMGDTVVMFWSLEPNQLT